MTINHHPQDETLAAYASGTLDFARRFVIEAHAHSCQRCRKSIGLMEEIAGALLAASQPAGMDPGCLQRVMARFDGEPAQIASSGRQSQIRPGLMRRVLDAPEQGAWAWAGPGLRLQSLHQPPGKGARLFLLMAVPGLGLPNHTHTGNEITLVLKGAFTHAGGRFAPGDCDDADDSDEHAPIVEPGEACICLIAMEGQLKLSGWLGRLAQPFVRI